MEDIILRVVLSFSFTDIELIKKFQDQIKPRERSTLIQFFIKQFLEKNDSSVTSKSSNTKNIQSAKKEVS